jgi:hypothetical protein
VISDTKMIVGFYQLDTIGQYTPFVGAVPRGYFLKFTVLNRGKKRHDFSVFGKRTRPIRPGGQAHIFKTATVRGKFRYASTLDKGKRFRGSITVL